MENRDLSHGCRARISELVGRLLNNKLLKKFSQIEGKTMVQYLHIIVLRKFDFLKTSDLDIRKIISRHTQFKEALKIKDIYKPHEKQHSPQVLSEKNIK